MPSQARYIWEASLGVLCILASFKLILYLSTFSQYPGSTSVVVQAESPVSHSSNYLKGRTLFQQNCAACHAIAKDLTGPALAGINERVPDRKRLFEWIKNSQKVLKTGDPYFNNLYQSYKKVVMSAFPQLSNEDIEMILEYIKIEEAKRHFRLFESQ